MRHRLLQPDSLLAVDNFVVASGDDRGLRRYDIVSVVADGSRNADSSAIARNWLGRISISRGYSFLTMSGTGSGTNSRGMLSREDDGGMGINNLGTLDYGCDFKPNATSD